MIERMLTETDLNNIREIATKFPCDHCRIFIPKLIDDLMHYRGLNKIYHGEILTLANEYHMLRGRTMHE